MLKNRNNRVELIRTESIGNVKRAARHDEVVIKSQIHEYLDGEYITQQGAFTNIDPDHAIKITTPKGEIYLPIMLYP